MSKRYRKKKTYRKKSSGKYGGYLDTASKALMVAYSVKKLLNVEKKKLDITFDTQITQGGVVKNLVTIAQGDKINERSGNSIRIQGLSAKYTLDSGLPAVVRCMVIKDNQQIQDADIGVTSLLSNIQDANGSIINNMLNTDTVGRYSVLMDKYHVLSVGAGLTRQSAFNLPANNHVRYNGVGTNDIQKNGLYMVVLSNQAADKTPGLRCVLRTNYTDN